MPICLHKFVAMRNTIGRFVASLAQTKVPAEHIKSLNIEYAVRGPGNAGTRYKCTQFGSNNAGFCCTKCIFKINYFPVLFIHLRLFARNKLPVFKYNNNNIKATVVRLLHPEAEAKVTITLSEIFVVRSC
jgi:hypothetical protein